MIVIEVGEDEIRYTSTTRLFGISKIPHNSLYLFGEVASAITNANGCNLHVGNGSHSSER